MGLEFKILTFLDTITEVQMTDTETGHTEYMTEEEYNAYQQEAVRDTEQQGTNEVIYPSKD